MARFTKTLVAKELEIRIRVAESGALYAYRDFKKAESTEDKETYYDMFLEDRATSFALRNFAEALGFKVILDDETCKYKVLVD